MNYLEIVKSLQQCILSTTWMSIFFLLSTATVTDFHSILAFRMVSKSCRPISLFLCEKGLLVNRLCTLAESTKSKHIIVAKGTCVRLGDGRVNNLQQSLAGSLFSELTDKIHRKSQLSRYCKPILSNLYLTCVEKS